jgi:hypothetical protein
MTLLGSRTQCLGYGANQVADMTKAQGTASSSSVVSDARRCCTTWVCSCSCSKTTCDSCSAHDKLATLNVTGTSHCGMKYLLPLVRRHALPFDPLHQSFSKAHTMHPDHHHQLLRQPPPPSPYTALRADSHPHTCAAHTAQRLRYTLVSFPLFFCSSNGSLFVPVNGMCEPLAGSPGASGMMPAVSVDASTGPPGLLSFCISCCCSRCAAAVGRVLALVAGSAVPSACRQEQFNKRCE